jgi:hypothetical protein
MKEKIRKHIGIIILIFLGVIILAVYEIPGGKKAAIPSPSPSSTPVARQVSEPPPGYKPPVYSEPATDENGEVDTGSEKVQTAINTKSKLESQLPIYIDGFQTSSGLKTTLNVYSIPEDPSYLIHVEIYGIDYSDPKILEPDNKNGLAFTESFKKIKALLTSKGVDIHNIYFTLGAKPYIQTAADSLIRKYNLF